MKKNLLFISLSLFAASQSGLSARDSRDTLPPAMPVINVSVASDAQSLARGFAAASASLSRPPITLAFQKEGVVRLLEDVRSIRDADGVIIVEVGRGMIYLLNPKDVLYVTDGLKIPVHASPPSPVMPPAAPTPAAAATKTTP